VITVTEAAKERLLEIKPDRRSNGEALRLDRAKITTNGDEPKLAVYLGEPEENALYTALNTLEESAAMCDRLAGRLRKDQRAHAAGRFEERAREARRQAAVIRRILTKEMPEAPPDAV
jgi:hypothetical protein